MRNFVEQHWGISVSGSTPDIEALTPRTGTTDLWSDTPQNNKTAHNSPGQPTSVSNTTHPNRQESDRWIQA